MWTNYGIIVLALEVCTMYYVLSYTQKKWLPHCMLVAYSSRGDANYHGPITSGADPERRVRGFLSGVHRKFLPTNHAHFYRCKM